MSPAAGGRRSGGRRSEFHRRNIVVNQYASVQPGDPRIDSVGFIFRQKHSTFIVPIF